MFRPTWHISALRLGCHLLILFSYPPFPGVKFLFCVVSLSSTRCRAGHVPEAGFRRHAPRQQEGSGWYAEKAGLMCNALSLMGTYISLSGRRSVLAITQPCCTAMASRERVKGCSHTSCQTQHWISLSHTWNVFDISVFFLFFFSPL